MVQLKKAIREISRRFVGERLTSRVGLEIRRRLRFVAHYRSKLRSKRGLEIGGPSALLARTGDFPIYDVLESLDNCVYSGNTIWTGKLSAGNTFVYDPGKRPGIQFICDATDLGEIRSSQYDCILACHCLEHVANPLRALLEWKRVLKRDGFLLLVLPHKDGTFDWRRPTTSLAHMVEDHKNAVGEDDLTHLSEIVELHDLSLDAALTSAEEFRQRCLANHTNRAMHHHVFDTKTALEILDHAGFRLIRVDYILPLNIIILARCSDQPVDNRRFLSNRSKHLSRSPFASDHHGDN